MTEAAVLESDLNVNQPVTDQTQPESKPIVRICEHIKDDGIRCGTPAVNGRHFCYYHCRAHHPGARISTRAYRSPIPDSVASLQIAIAHTLQALTSGDIPPKQANSIFYGIHLATKLLRLSKPLTETEQQQVVTEIPKAMNEVLVEPEPHVQPEYEPEAEPDPLTLEQHRANILGPDQLEEIYRVIRAGKGEPGYAEAVTRLYAHSDAQVAVNCARQSHPR